MVNYSNKCVVVEKKIDSILSRLIHTKKDIGYGVRRTFPNWQWFDIVDYHKKGIVILRVGRGARLVRQYPVLAGLFDDVLTVIAKLHISDAETIDEKHMIWVFELLSKAPKGIRYDD